MKRIAVVLLSVLAVSADTAPAHAYCVVNQTSMTLEASLLSPSPLGNFRKLVKPGGRVCCDWFSRGCNPGMKRNTLLSLSVGTPSHRKASPLPSVGPVTRYVPIPTYDRYGNPDPHGHYDKYGVYDEHGHKPYFEPIQTFDEHGNPDPRGHYDRFGVYDSHGHQRRHGRLVIPKGAMVTVGPDEHQQAKPHYCSRGKSRNVLISADGTVTVKATSLTPGGLRCESRDHFLRPISPPSQAQEFGVPLLGLPPPPR